MQDDLVWGDPDSTDNTKNLESPNKYMVSPQKSILTSGTVRTGGSKRSTEEEELRSLSTTPRYSHEDLGRIVSPPTYSDDSSDETEHNIDDTLSTQQVLLKSRTSQFTHPNALISNDKDSVKSDQTQKTQSNKLSYNKAFEYPGKDSINPGQKPHGGDIFFPEKDSPRSGQEPYDKDISLPKKYSHISIQKLHGGDIAFSKDSHRSGQKLHGGDISFSKKDSQRSVQKLHGGDISFSKKDSQRSVQKPHGGDISFSDKASLNSRISSTALELPSLKATGEHHKKLNYTDNDFRRSYRPSGGPRYNQIRASVGTDYNRLRVAELMDMRMSSVDANLREIMMDAESVQRDLSNEYDQRTMLENRLQELDEERKELNSKLATLRVKLGVANSNYNVSKTESDQMRKKYQDTQIQKARLEERIQTCTKDLEKLKDPDNPDSNINLKKIVLNDRKEIRRFRTDLEGVRSERSEIQNQIQDRDEKIKMLNIYIGEAKDQLEECSRDHEVATISVTAERKKREEVEEKYNELMKDKDEFDGKMAEILAQLDVAVTGTTGIQKQSDEYRDKEHNLVTKIDVIERKLRDTLTSVEHEKNRNMPFRTATSIKHHQFRMTTSGWVTDTTPHVIVTTNANASIASSGFLGKTVVSTKPVKSLPAGKSGSKPTPRSKGSSMPARK